MATGGVTLTEDDLSCEICFHLYSDPMALKCLHTFCGKCISQLAGNRRKVECPNCREKTNLADVRKDFRIQKLLDQYLHGQVSNTSTNTVPVDDPELPDFSVLRTNEYVQCKAAVDSTIYRIQIIDDKLYCACGYFDIKVYNKNCRFIRSIASDKFRFVTAVAKSATGDLIVSCLLGDAGYMELEDESGTNFIPSGLHQVTSEGRYVTLVAEGEFYDVCVYNDTVYGLTRREIQLFQLKNNEYVKVGNIALIARHMGNNLCINKESIYISTLYFWEPSTIFAYNHATQNMREVTDTLHSDWNPVVCSTDSHSNVLVVDRQSQTVNVYFKDVGHWYEVLSVGDTLTDAVVDEDGDNIWVATSERLLKYTSIL